MSYKKYTLILAFFTLYSCGETQKEPKAQTEEESRHAAEEVMLSEEKITAMGIKMGPLTARSFSTFVEASGQLEVPPQNTAMITTPRGAKVTKILVIEGDKVKKGEVVAYISHPDLIALQTDFLRAHNQLALLKSEYERQEKLYEAGVVSGAEFQRAKSAYEVAQGLESGLEAQLRLLHLNPKNLLSGNIVRQIPLVSPIDGAIQNVKVMTGQYVQPQTSLFEIVNTEHVHVDLMVFENDVRFLEVGQKINFEVQSLPGETLTAEIISIGKTFEEGPKAVHVHAEIMNKPKNLIPGMYVSGKIAVGKTKSPALPADAVVREENKAIAFKVVEEGDAWSFQPVEVIPGQQNETWVAVEFPEKPATNTQFALNNAYYLMAEMKKGEGGHHH